MVAELGLDRPADLARLHFEGDLLELGDHLSPAEGSQLPALPLPGRVIRVFVGQLGEVLSLDRAGVERLGLLPGLGVGRGALLRIHLDEDVRGGHLLGHLEGRAPPVVVGLQFRIGDPDSRVHLPLVHDQVLRAPLHRRLIAVLVLLEVRLQVRVGDRRDGLELARRDLDVFDRGLVVAVGELALEVLVRHENGGLDEGRVLLEEHSLPHVLLEALGRVAVGPEEPLVFLVADEVAFFLQLGERDHRGRDLLVADLEVEPPGRLQAQGPVDHGIEHLAGHVERADQLGGELALVLLLLPVERRPVLAIELDRRDRIASDLRNHLARGVAPAGVRAGEVDEAEDEDDDDGEQRPLEVVEAVPHGFEHLEEPPGNFSRTGDYSRDEAAGDRWRSLE